ncbi:MAG: outer membrane protein assembly factor BamB family protein [Candidatus Thorarchaeota archaeon]
MRTVVLAIGVGFVLSLITITPIVSGTSWGSSAALDSSYSPHMSRSQVSAESTYILDWSYQTTAMVHCSPCVVDVDYDGDLEVIFGSYDNNLYCLDSLGNVEWSYSTSDAVWGSVCVADVDDDDGLEIIFGSFDDSIYCLSASGIKEWSYLTNGDIYVTPSVADLDKDGTLEILVGSNGNLFYCLDHTGELEWSYSTDRWVRASPVIIDINNDDSLDVIIGSYDGYLYCLDATGGLQWRFLSAINEGFASTPSIADVDGDDELEILVGSLDHYFYCLDAAGGLEWRYPTTHWFASSACVVDIDQDNDEEILVGTVDGQFICFDGFGNVEWNYPVGNQVHWSSPSVTDVDGDGSLEVLFGSHDTFLYCLGSDGTLEWRYDTGGHVESSPRVVNLDGDDNMEVLFGSKDWTMYCIEVEWAGVADYQWPSIGFKINTRHTGYLVDYDNDLLHDHYELFVGTSIDDADTDHDTFDDYWEFIHSTKPFVVVEIQYDNALFGYSTNGVATEWDPGLIETRSRWLLWGSHLIDQTISSNVQIDLAWCSPEPDFVTDTTYTWYDIQPTIATEFLMVPEVLTDPGVRVVRVTNVSSISPGWNAVRMNVEVTFLRNPTVGSQEYPIQGGWLGIGPPVWPGLTFDFLTSQFLSFQVEVGDIVATETIANVYNPYSQHVKFMPTIDLSLYIDQRLHSEDQFTGKDPIQFEIVGPADDHLIVSTTSEQGQFFDVRQHCWHGDIWLWFEGHQYLTAETENPSNPSIYPPFLKGTRISLGSGDATIPTSEACYVVHGFLVENWKDLSANERLWYLKDLKINLLINQDGVKLSKWRRYYESILGLEDVMVIMYYVQFRAYEFTPGTYEFRGEWIRGEHLDEVYEINVTFVQG